MKQKIEIKVSKLVAKVESQIVDLVNEVNTDYDCISDLSEYRKDIFNENFGDLKKSYKRFAIAKAIIILDYINFFELRINGTAYNLLRHLVTIKL